MHTLKKFIHYYGPYKAVFFLDLICATIISLVDLAYPQILRTCTNTLFTKSSSSILSALLPIAAGLLIMYLIQSLCKYYVSYQGHMMGAYMERICVSSFLTTMKNFLFLIMIRTTPDR